MLLRFQFLVTKMKVPSVLCLPCTAVLIPTKLSDHPSNSDDVLGFICRSYMEKYSIHNFGTGSCMELSSEII
ncbi:hypothetical protein M758_4G052300 [Ceratodon purpureus]|uniref:Secreted protein n=1 Tax=Ceratodon purpureus TaxID=3225 RepID=A0A8T0I7B1_CERPU|nr:hypothetical protein KC19_4G055300 [Ceratodon purpureus]KAG0618292.1 hypothetical protein M758_4G052300 [Ceratodon purpureus]